MLEYGYGGRILRVDLTERFLRDLRRTVSEVTLANYIDRLRERIAPYGVRFSSEPYGRLCVNSLDYAARSDFPIAEFWTEWDNINFMTQLGHFPSS